MSKILVLGGTGAMGRYLVPRLVTRGDDVDVIALDKGQESAHLHYTVGNAMEDGFLAEVLKKGYDAVVDFMSYTLPRFEKRMPMLLDRAGQYLFLSSCRVYANEEIPVKETSPRLLDVATDPAYLARREVEYSLYKAIEENMLRESGRNNFTIIRPATTYSTGRAQLVTLEAESFLWRALHGKRAVVPREAMDCEATLSWGGDVAEMIASLVLNPAALGEDFIVATAEHHTWREIAGYYHELVGLEYVETDKETYLRCIADENWYPHALYQLTLARMFTRITDNQKILKISGMKQEKLMPLYDGLKLELSQITADSIRPNAFINRQMDAFLERQGK